MSETKRSQCCKCRWVGTDDEKIGQDRNKSGMITLVCPMCEECEEFYEATERKYRNYLKRINK